MPAIAAITVMPDTSTARPEVAAAASSAASSRAPRGALLALTAQVEHRVVDAHGQSDQQHDRADRLVHRPDLADRADQADRRGHRGDGEQQGHEGRQQRAKSKDQDDQGDRQGGDLRLLEVVLERLARAPCPRWRRRTPRSGSPPPGGRAWPPRRAPGRPCPRCRRRPLEGHQRRLAVLGQRALVALGIRALDVLHVLGVLEPRLRPSAPSGGTRDSVAGPVLALDQDALAVLLGEMVGDRLVGAARFTDAVLLSDSVFVPTEPPMKTARITNASQPKIAFFLCCALQRPARAARFFGVPGSYAAACASRERLPRGPARFIRCG